MYCGLISLLRIWTGPLKNITGGTAGLEASEPMKTRIVTALILIPLLFIVVLSLPEIVSTVILGLFTAVASYELLTVTGLVKHVRLNIYAAVMAVLVCLWSHYDMNYAWGLLGLLAFVSLLFGEMMHDHVRVTPDMLGITAVAGVLIPFLLSSIVRIHNTRMGRFFIMMPFVMALMPDSGAYFAGKFFGKHKMAPVLSPKKTIEGLIGGIFTGMFSMVIYALILQLGFGQNVDYMIAVCYGFIGALGATFGDLCFSVIKRQTGLKDYGSLFPGHGGILDRFDSLVIVAPLTEALLILLPFVR
jgi:phosphatidate cytidylyltransferase